MIIFKNASAVFVHYFAKVRLFLDCSSFIIVVIFNNTSAEIKTKSVDVFLKITTILKELRIVQLRSKNKWILDSTYPILYFYSKVLQRIWDFFFEIFLY